MTTGQILLDEYTRLLGDRTKLVAVTQVSNALGTITPVRQIIDLAHRVGARVLVDGAQSVAHLRVNVQELDADFFVFSGHKIYGPTGIGVLYGKSAVLEQMPPYQGGGNMITDVTFERSIFQSPPGRFEAGHGQHRRRGRARHRPGLPRAIGPGKRRALRTRPARIRHRTHGPGSWAAPDRYREGEGQRAVVRPGRVHADEVGEALNRDGIAVRAGHHCAQPILRRFGLEATVRPSLALYNTCSEVDEMVAVLHRLANSGPRSRA